MALFKQAKLVIPSRKTDVRAQFAALCFRWIKEQRESRILLISSRDSGRWILPKGWPVNGRTPAQSALLESYEEAGVQGKVYDQCMGHYSYTKLMGNRRAVACVVGVYPIRVKSLLKKFPERGERRRIWLSPKDAAKMISEPALKPMLRQFDPRKLR